ncbi:hypothetical protein [Nocardioides cynanchi]|uniref:hypothetical protein n=1 Tax=Nocardioides cynanchi TaxID=2558918 RepID=UPI001245CB85|nr:hypothetical protein [Nocardioides cynanchi]
MIVEMQLPAVTQVTATAIYSDGCWLVCLAGSPEIHIRVPHLRDVDTAMSQALRCDLGREDVNASVYIRWYDANYDNVTWPLDQGAPAS